MAVEIRFGISIHAAREGGDGYDGAKGFDSAISIHAAREGGDRGRKMKYCKYLISIHAAREGGDEILNPDGKPLNHFNPRRP